ncbi:MAG: hypothetical protein IID41_02675 [Planctomycetes bacterium]|nr:hypothetical protein [Planctomycetota bacterium]
MQRMEVDVTPEEQARLGQYLASRGFGELSRVAQWGRVRSAIIPWIELSRNRPDQVQNCADGLNTWAGVCDRAIVTTGPLQLGIYEELRARVHGVTIIPGLKTNDDLRGGFDNVAGWKRISVRLDDMAERTGSKIVVLENESASRAYALGQQQISFAALRRALSQLPRGLEIWWYPAVTGSSNAQLGRMQRVCRVVADTLKVTFVDLSRSGPAAVRNTWSKRQRERLLDVVNTATGAATVDMLYFYGPGSKWWMYEQIHKALAVLGDGVGEAIIYPGAEGWKDAATAISKALVARG